MKTNPFSLAGKNIVITGASSGIGESCAHVCASMGAKLLLIGRDKTRLKKLLLDISITGDIHSFGIADLLQPESINKVIEEFILKSGPVSGFIHSAGIEITTPLAFLKKEQFNQIFSVNFLSGIDLAKIISKKGNFTNISNRFGL